MKRFILIAVFVVAALYPAEIIFAQWQQLPGKAQSVSAGADGSLWIIGMNNSPYFWDEDEYEWVQISGTAQKIAITPDGTPVVINQRNEIYVRRGDNWERMPGSATEISIGANGDKWILGTNQTPYKWDPESGRWQEFSGTAVRIAADQGGRPWLVNRRNEIFRQRGRSWERMPGSAQDVEAGADGTVFIIGSNTRLYKWDEEEYQWYEYFDREHNYRIAVTANGRPVVIECEIVYNEYGLQDEEKCSNGIVKGMR